MASDAVSTKPLTSPRSQSKSASTFSAWDVIVTLGRPLASLKLTVALFAMGIFIILVGTLAQVNMDMWQVMDRYFKSYIAWIDLQVFLPRSWFPNWQSVGGGFWFPGGASIGLLMVINLLAAHMLRFKIQARNRRLWIGLAMMVVGVVVTTLVIISGHDSTGFQSEPIIEWTTLWVLVKLSVGALGIAGLTSAVLLPPRANSNRMVERVGLAFLGATLFLLATYWFFAGENAYLGDAGMRILWQLILGTLSGIVILAASVILFRKRGGVVTVHLGIGLLMFGQFWVSKYDKEERMSIEEGQTISYAIDIRNTELAVVDSSDPARDEVVAIPQPILVASANDGQRSFFAQLTGGDLPVDETGAIQHPKLPFEVEVLKYYKNAKLVEAEEGDENLATDGLGKTYIAEPLRASTGTDSDSAVDLAAAYVKLTSTAGEDLGTYLVSQIAASQDLSEQVTAGDKSYDIALRFERRYKPYAVTLLDVRKDDYLGTDTPRNYSSDIRLVDKETGTDREIHIWMNNPLRYAGETFYQSSYSGPPMTPTETTTLSVVTNSGWMIPYVACMVVVVGLLAHFTGTLNRFLLRDRTRSKAEEVSDSSPLDIWLPLAVVALFALMLGRALLPSDVPAGDMQLQEFGKLPVIADGRVKPFDTLARNSLRAISNRHTFKGRLSEDALQAKWGTISEKLADRYDNVSADEIGELAGDIDATIALIAKETDGNAYRIGEQVDKLTTERLPAIRWLLDTITRPDLASDHKVFRIDNLEVLDTLGLERRKSHLYSVNELRPKINEFEEQVAQAIQQDREDAGKLTTYQRKLIELDRRIRTYTRLAAAFQPPSLPPLPTADELESDREAAMEKLRTFHQAYTAFVQSIDSIKPALAVPHETEDGTDEWESYAEAWAAGYIDARLLGRQPNQQLEQLNKILVAYEDGDAKEFNQQVARYQESLQTEPPEQLQVANTIWNGLVSGLFGSFYGFEAAFNDFAPFFFCWWPYIGAFVLSSLAWLGWTRPLNRAAFCLILVTLIVHTLALGARIYISGRPPVTNLYSSAVFIGWGVVVFGLVLEWVYRNGIGNVVGSALGFASLVVAHFLAGDGDTFTVLQAVLDTQFWLAVHVVTVTLGYATTFLAGFLGIVYILRGLFSRSLTADARKELARMIYGVVCFSIFFSFFGTVLGGLWADDSWGRFWGWDPKENGALIIVLWNALVLHARWGGMVKERGLAVLAVGGNIVTSWSWFGVNELGVGLHSYGFTEGVLLTLSIFVGTQLAMIILGVMPTSLWSSYRSDLALSEK